MRIVGQSICENRARNEQRWGGGEICEDMAHNTLKRENQRKEDIWRKG